MKIEALAWDSAFFSKKIGRLDWDAKDSQVPPEIGQYDLLYLFFPVSQPLPAELAASARHYDTKVIFEKTLIPQKEKNLPNLCRITESSAELLALAYQSGWRSRFFEDPDLAPRAQKMYQIWVEKYLADPTAVTFGWLVQNQLSSMINCKFHDGVGNIGLFAVDSAYRGQGIGRALMNAVEAFLISHDVACCQVATQKENNLAMNAYFHYGFRIVSETAIWHWRPSGITNIPCI